MANNALTDLERKLTLYLMELRGSPVIERVNLYVAKMTGGKLLSAYLHDASVPIKERAALADTLCDILFNKDYARLPEVSANAGSNGHGQPAPTAARGRCAEASENNGNDDSADESDEPPADEPMNRAEIEQLVRVAVRRELGGVLELVAKVLKETK